MSADQLTMNLLTVWPCTYYHYNKLANQLTMGSPLVQLICIRWSNLYYSSQPVSCAWRKNTTYSSQLIHYNGDNTWPANPLTNVATSFSAELLWPVNNGNCQVLQPVNDGYNPLNDVRDDYLNFWSSRIATDGVFPHCSALITMMMVGDLIVTKSMKADKYTSIGKKGQQRIEQMAKIQKIVTSAGWLDQCPDGPHQWTLQKIEPEVATTFTMVCRLSGKASTGLAERNKALPAQSGSIWHRSIKMMFNFLQKSPLRRSIWALIQPASLKLQSSVIFAICSILCWPFFPIEVYLICFILFVNY